MEQRAHESIGEEDGGAHGADARLVDLVLFADEEEAQDRWAHEGNKGSGCCMDAEGVGADVNGKTQEEGPQHKLVARHAVLESEHKVDVEEGGGNTKPVDAVQDEDLQEQKAYEPEYAVEEFNHGAGLGGLLLFLGFCFL